MTIYAYRQGFKFFEISYGAAVSVGILLITLVLSMVYYFLLRRER
jgi:ABC-type sugar transport system permease subunit